MYEGSFPLLGGIILSLVEITSGEGPTHLKVIGKGTKMAHRQTHIEKSIYFSNLST